MTLYMERNELEGTIPETLANLASLEELNLTGNRFEGKKTKASWRVSSFLLHSFGLSGFQYGGMYCLFKSWWGWLGCKPVVIPMDLQSVVLLRIVPLSSGGSGFTHVNLAS